MHLTRFGFNMIVAVYLAPLVFIDFIGNAMVEGAMSDYYYYKFMLDAALLVVALAQLFRGETAHVDHARDRTRGDVGSLDEEVVGFSNVSSLEYLYCGALSAYAAVNWYFLHAINKASTGVLSMTSLAWSMLSIAICVLAAIQFYHLKSGTIVELRKRIAQ